MADVKLTREGLRAAIKSLTPTLRHAPENYQVLLAATHALLAATEPASDEEIAPALNPIIVRARDLGRPAARHLSIAVSAYRAAEARVRRLAGLEE